MKDTNKTTPAKATDSTAIGPKALNAPKGFSKAKGDSRIFVGG